MGLLKLPNLPDDGVPRLPALNDGEMMPGWLTGVRA